MLQENELPCFKALQVHNFPLTQSFVLENQYTETSLSEYKVFIDGIKGSSQHIDICIDWVCTLYSCLHQYLYILIFSEWNKSVIERNGFHQLRWQSEVYHSFLVQLCALKPSLGFSQANESRMDAFQESTNSFINMYHFGCVHHVLMRQNRCQGYSWGFSALI